MINRAILLPALAAALLLGSVTSAQDGPAASPADGARTELSRAVAVILELQEGDGNREWPYEGVYRVRGRIPIGYRIGGTAICAMALLHAPGFQEDETARAAVARATAFVCAGVDEPLMAHEVEATYDVRGWGYTYGLLYLLRLKALGAIPAETADAVESAIGFYMKGIAETEIPRFGGWNYARRGGFDQPGPPSPFMTAPTLQAMFEAADQGYDVDRGLVERGLEALLAARTPTGAYSYAGRSGGARSAVPGAIGRMAVSETTLHLAGRSSLLEVRGAIDAFFTHWEWLEKRRARPGTHLPPYDIAPYYYFYAHYYVAQAIELMPDRDREEYRRRLRELLAQVRGEDGGWNDRVFPRSANYGTAMALMALTMPEHPAPARWGE